MIEIQLVWCWLQTRRQATMQSLRDDPDRGDIVQTAIIIGLFAAAAILVVGILVGKAKSAANNVQIQ